MSQTLAVIGAGVAATSVIHWLKTLHPLDKIVQYSSENLAPSASVKSTAVAALRGTQRGLSELGDELCEHWEFSDEFYSQLKAPGLVQSELETWLSEDKDIRRYSHFPQTQETFLKPRLHPLKIVREKCWMIDPTLFLSSFDQTHEHHQSLVTEIKRSSQRWSVATFEEVREFDKVILCTGAWQCWMKDFFPHSELDSLRASQGSYYEWEKIQLASKSFALSVQGLNLHYRHDRQTLQLGATTLKGVDSFIPSQIHLSEMRKRFQDWFDLDLDFSQASVHTGIRSILKSRRPFVGEMSDGLYAMNGLYKNGWISAWPLAKRLCSRL